MELRRMGAITEQCKLATHSKQMSKLLCISLFQIFLVTFLPNII